MKRDIRNKIYYKITHSTFSYTKKVTYSIKYVAFFFISNSTILVES